MATGAVTGTATPAHAAAPTASVDPMRTGWDDQEPALTQSAVASSDFGQLFSTTVDGQVYAQPIVVGRKVIAATENNQVYGMDANTWAIAWRTCLCPAWSASSSGCVDLAPNCGVTSHPV